MSRSKNTDDKREEIMSELLKLLEFDNIEEIDELRKEINETKKHEQ